MPDFRDEVRRRLATLKLEATREAAIVEELGQHLEDRYADLKARGTPDHQAYRGAVAELDDRDLLAAGLKQVERQPRLDSVPAGGPWYGASWEHVGQDVRYALRSLRLSPSFTAVAILSLALGIGANTAIFQLLNAVRLRSLPVRNPEELVYLKPSNSHGRSGNFRGSFPTFTNPIWEQIRDHQQAFSAIAAWNSTSFNLATGGRSRITRGMYVSGDFFNTLGVLPVAGRLISSADDSKGCGLPGAVISFPFWQREYGGRASAVGSKLTLDGHPMEIIGVTPAGFYGVEVGNFFDIAVPVCSEAAIDGEYKVIDRRDGWWLAVVGRLKPGLTTAKATAQLESISPGIFQATVPERYKEKQAKEFLEWKLAAYPASAGLSNLRNEYEQPLWMLLAIAGTVLLIACANLANLMFAKANAREREIAVRLAIGASRSRLLQQLMTESLLVAAIGAASGVLLAQVLSRVLVSFLNTSGGRVSLNVAVDWRVLGFSGLIAVITCLFFGLTPAMRATATPPIVAMKAGARGAIGRRERLGMRRALVVTQVALSMVLLVAALLFVRSFQKLVSLDAGFRQTGILVADLDFTQLNIPAEIRNSFKQQLADRMQALPGVESAAAVTIVPVSGNGWNDTVHTNASGEELQEVAWFNRVSPGFFKTMDTPILRGRDVSMADTINSPAVAVINETFARKLFRNKDPLGQIFKVDEGAGKPESVYQVVGIVKDTKYQSLREELSPIAFVPRGQDKHPDTDCAIVMRSDLPLDSLTAAVEHAIAEINPAILIQFTVLKTQIRDTLVRERLMASLSGFFGVLAAVLTTIGLYGLISYMAVRRRNEIGIRIALGADRLRVLNLVMREALELLAIGLVTGAALSWWISRAARSMLFGVKNTDPTIFGLAVVLLAVVAITASFVPAQRASHLDPLEVLREE
ncbi:MAG TPA: ABC transporter permease [Terriglobales bacterium]|nr:ABC transporter permease [Terriglobales bacterium]